ncbi:hypothetical protein B0H10DRAFT_1951175 [Mycena sp. CBHHK59/15]|nr:hypothetical protein B0H10DRAFT_1951175 [Mycena sp. CBHHK59/15]
MTSCQPAVLTWGLLDSRFSMNIGKNGGTPAYVIKSAKSQPEKPKHLNPPRRNIHVFLKAVNEMPPEARPGTKSAKSSENWGDSGDYQIGTQTCHEVMSAGYALVLLCSPPRSGPPRRADAVRSGPRGERQGDVPSGEKRGLGGTLFPPANNAVKLVLNVLFRAVDDTSLRHVMGMSREFSALSHTIYERAQLDISFVEKVVSSTGPVLADVLDQANWQWSTGNKAPII